MRSEREQLVDSLRAEAMRPRPKQVMLPDLTIEERFLEVGREMAMLRRRVKRLESELAVAKAARPVFARMGIAA